MGDLDRFLGGGGGDLDRFLRFLGWVTWTGFLGGVTWTGFLGG